MGMLRTLAFDDDSDDDDDDDDDDNDSEGARGGPDAGPPCDGILAGLWFALSEKPSDEGNFCQD